MDRSGRGGRSSRNRENSSFNGQIHVFGGTQCQEMIFRRILQTARRYLGLVIQVVCGSSSMVEP